METDGARWQFRAKQILQIMWWAQWHTGSWIAPQEMTKGKIKHLRGLQRGGQLDGKTFPGQIYHKMKSRCLRVELDEWFKDIFSPFLLKKHGYSNHPSSHPKGYVVSSTLSVPEHCLLINPSFIHLHIDSTFSSKRHLNPTFHFNSCWTWAQTRK